MYIKQKGAAPIKEEFEIALLNLLQDGRIEVLIDGNILTGKDALKLKTKDIVNYARLKAGACN